MTPQEHYTAAESLIDDVHDGAEPNALAEAQVHATLALAAAVSEIAKLLAERTSP